MIQPNASRATAGRSVGLSGLIALLMALLLGVFGLGAPQARADESAERPAVLVIDAGLGDGQLAELHWLGEGAAVVGEAGGMTLSTIDNPSWWTASETSGAAPATFFLRPSTGGAVTADTIVWALNQVRETTGDARTFVIGIGPVGLQLRAYVEDLASTPQSSRADIVGLALIGVPSNGYSAMTHYPESDLWTRLGASAGLTLDDLTTESAWLAALNQARFPNVVKTLVIAGAVGDLGFGLTDGAGAPADFVLNEAVSDQVETTEVSATVGQQLDLTSLWNPFTSSIDYPTRAVDGALTERLSGMASYELAPDVLTLVQQFYEAWFGNGAPVTHNSSVLLLDTSGSMLESIGHGETKLQAAKEAADQYLLTMQSFESLPQSPPMDVAVYGFNETVTPITEGYSDEAIARLNSMAAVGETNIGQALERAVTTLDTRPVGATKHILLLSDGESTRGMSDAQMLSGPVAKARDRGIAIDAVGFGNVGESDASFLQQVTEATGGAYYQADNAYSLKVDFLKSYYDSLGVNLVDEDLPQGAQDKAIGAVDEQTLALQMGVIGQNTAPDIELLLNNTPVDPSLYTVEQNDDLTSLQYVGPEPGEYAVRIGNPDQESHLFSVAQRGIGDGVDVSGEEVDYSLIILIVCAVIVAGVIIGLIIAMNRKGRQAQAPASPQTDATPDHEKAPR